MPDFVHKYSLRADIRSGVARHYSNVMIGLGDKLADVFEVKVYDSQLPLGYDAAGADISGCTGLFIRPDGETVTITGTATSGGGTVTLPANCYAYTGEFKLTIKFTYSTTVTVTAAIIEGRVLETRTNLVADPDDVFDVNAIMSALEGKIDEPASEGTSGQALITDGAGGRSWGSVTSAAAGALTIGGTTYQLRTGSSGASGYITFVTE